MLNEFDSLNEIINQLLIKKFINDEEVSEVLDLILTYGCNDIEYKNGKFIKNGDKIDCDILEELFIKIFDKSYMIDAIFKFIVFDVKYGGKCCEDLSFFILDNFNSDNDRLLILYYYAKKHKSKYNYLLKFILNSIAVVDSNVDIILNILKDGMKYVKNKKIIENIVDKIKYSIEDELIMKTENFKKIKKFINEYGIDIDINVYKELDEYKTISNIIDNLNNNKELSKYFDEILDFMLEYGYVDGEFDSNANSFKPLPKKLDNNLLEKFFNLVINYYDYNNLTKCKNNLKIIKIYFVHPYVATDTLKKFINSLYKNRKSINEILECVETKDDVIAFLEGLKTFYIIENQNNIITIFDILNKFFPIGKPIIMEIIENIVKLINEENIEFDGAELLRFFEEKRIKKNFLNIFSKIFSKLDSYYLSCFVNGLSYFYNENAEYVNIKFIKKIIFSVLNEKNECNIYEFSDYGKRKFLDIICNNEIFNDVWDKVMDVLDEEEIKKFIDNDSKCLRNNILNIFEI